MPVPASNVAKKGLASQPHHLQGAHLRGYYIKHLRMFGMHLKHFTLNCETLW